MIEHTNITIIQYNTNRSKDKVQRDFLQNLNPKIHHIIAIQEPWINHHSARKTTCTHPGYTAIVPQTENPRVAMYISKDIKDTSYNVHTGQWTDTGDAQTVSIQIPGEEKRLWIHNWYNPPPTSHSSQDKGTLQWMEEAISRDGPQALVGDFNLHHPRWGSDFRPAHHHLAGHLLQTTESAGMTLSTPKGMTTWENQRSSTTIDLTFITGGLMGRVIECNTSEDLHTGSDHLPVMTKIHMGPESTPERPPRLLWKNTNWEELDEEMGKILGLQGPIQCPDGTKIRERAEHITETIQKAIRKHVPIAKPSQWAKPYWTKACTEKVKGARRARRKWTKQKSQENWEELQRALQEKKNQIKTDKEIGWRALVTEAASSPQSMWKIAKWARKSEDQRDTTIPDILDAQGRTHTDPEAKATAMAAHFFPQPAQADLTDILGTRYPEPLCIEKGVSEEDIITALRTISPDKAPGPDKIPNRLLKQCKSLYAPLAQLFTACLEIGYHPPCFKESTTIVLRKPQKPAYNVPKSYRPIALLNTMGKLLEKIVANRLSAALEEKGLLPEGQMGGRPRRSTLTAMELLVEKVRTVWNSDKRQVASLLCLDISGAFDYVSHDRLIHIMKRMGLPSWMTNFTRSFLTGRSTRLTLGSFTSTKRDTATGIPQGSTLSPALFLVFVSELLPMLNSWNSMASGFVDDTNILTWSQTTEGNCKRLEELHTRCEKWAERHGARFAPEKYQLIHFTRSRTRHNMEAKITIQGHTSRPEPCVRILGLWVTPRLSWGQHVKKANQRAEANMDSLTRLTTSTWGATFAQARQLYTAIVRPAMTYGSPIWATDNSKGKIPQVLLTELERTQAKALRRMTGAYKSVPLRALEHEANILPIDIYLQQLRIQHSALTVTQPCQRYIEKMIKVNQRRGTPSKTQRQKDIDTWNAEMSTAVDRGRFLPPRAPTKAEIQEKRTRIKELKGRSQEKWRNRWNEHRGRTQRYYTAAQPKLWNAASTQDKEEPQSQLQTSNPYNIHGGLTRAQSSVITQLRTEHIGFREYLRRRRVPEVDNKKCQCGYPSQNVKHMLLYCPGWAKGRGGWLRKARSKDIQSLLNDPEDVRRITRWIIQEGLIEQFKLSPVVERLVQERKKGQERKDEQRCRAEGRG